MVISHSCQNEIRHSKNNFFDLLHISMANFENQSSQESQVHSALRTSEDEIGITLRADIRRRTQELKIKMMNAELPGATDAMKATHKQLMARVGHEAAGEWGIATAKSPEELQDSAIALTIQAENATTSFAAANARMQAAKLRSIAGDNLEDELDWLRAIVNSAHTVGQNSPLNYLPDATLLGLQKHLVEQHPVPSHERVIHALKSHRGHEILRDWSLVMPEDDRAQFLHGVPQQEEREIGVRLDEQASTILHGARIEPGSEDSRQRKAVRARVYNELRMAIEDSSPGDVQVVAALGRAMLHLGSDTKNLVLDIVRDEMERRDTGDLSPMRVDYIPHMIGVLLKLIEETDDFRANDIALQLVGDTRTPPGVAASIFKKLVTNKYLDASLGTWWNARRNLSQEANKREGFARGRDTDREDRLEVLQALIGQLGVVPSREVVEFLDLDARWPAGTTLNERAAKIKASEVEFSRATTQRELVDLLVADETKAMTYFLLHGGEDRFNLINNYSFEKFKEMLGLIGQLKEHPEPVKKFTKALVQSGVSLGDAQSIIDRLKSGRFHAADRDAAHQEINFEVSENAAVKNANAEIGRVLGKGQLGCVLLVPVYRDYLVAETSDLADELSKQLAAAQTFEERNRAIAEINVAFPTWRSRAEKDLQESWTALGEKMVLGVTLNNIFDEQSVQIRAEELIPRINTKRVDLKRMKKDLIVALKSDNEKITKIVADIERTRRAIGEAKDERSAAFMRDNLRKLEAKRVALGNEKISDRFAHLSKAERDAQVEELGSEIVALTEKSPSAIFTYLTMQVLGEDRLTEQDRVLIQEMESHLQGPFQTIVDAKTYQTKQNGGVPARRRQVNMEWLDKRERFMSMMRFADSKICCFSSSNYEMKVQHDTPNKYWVASINADPMSFVIALEQPREVEARVHENDGFIFGSFATDERGDLAVMLNGIYYAPGIEDSRQVEEMLGGVERMIKGLPVRTIALASQHGGSVKMPEDFKQQSIRLTRLRALDSGEGASETRVYDDLGTGNNMNEPHDYNDLWVKRIDR